MLLWLMKTPTQLTDNANAWAWHGMAWQCGKPFPLSPAPPRGNWQNPTTNISITIYAIFGSVNLTPRPAYNLPRPSDFHPHPRRSSLVSFTNQESTFCKPCFWKCSNSIYKVSWWLHSSKAIPFELPREGGGIIVQNNKQSNYQRM